jgi:hypothetical protein
VPGYVGTGTSGRGGCVACKPQPEADSECAPPHPAGHRAPRGSCSHSHPLVGHSDKDKGVLWRTGRQPLPVALARSSQASHATQLIDGHASGRESWTPGRQAKKVQAGKRRSRLHEPTAAAHRSTRGFHQQARRRRCAQNGERGLGPEWRHPPMPLTEAAKVADQRTCLREAPQPPSLWPR